VRAPFDEILLWSLRARAVVRAGHRAQILAPLTESVSGFPPAACRRGRDAPSDCAPVFSRTGPKIVLPAGGKHRSRRLVPSRLAQVRLGTIIWLALDLSWKSRGSERCAWLGSTDISLPERVASITQAAVVPSVAFRLRWRWLELGGWYAEATDTRLHLKDYGYWSQTRRTALACHV
jgi:hypothetical protein